MERSSRTIRVTVLATTLVLLLCGIVSYLALRASAAAIGQVADTEDTLLSLERVLSVVRDAETGQRGFLLTENASYLEPYYAAIAALSERMATLRSKLAGEPTATRQLDELQRLIKAKTDELTKTIEFEQAGNRAAAIALVMSDQGKNLMDSIRAQIARIQAVQSQVLAAQLAVESRARIWTSLCIVAAWVLALALVRTLVLVVRHDNRRVRLSEQRLAITLRSIGDAVIATDALGRVRMLNTVAEEVTGWPTAEAQGAPLDQIFRRRARRPKVRSIRRCAKAGSSALPIIRY
jgi:CHASE3 domain sensor protein